ncbi:CaiB/BaiF CoA-transferase family protein [Clostridium sp. MB40-C1]|uniref:CaiB/BaiF CoA transferase family protein n=1 Tax=Clostridium sp. MB40-C1 TaxID=3070996 RepID=UPI0027DEDBD2|nr:CaiB/BaiF CoA-transferase family protein [Clostridium sp. MB40-C1]WMJ79190.1 CaiB/BaiF CoA-transferase family protein [Clostridium sp. MB40-C1]
MSLPLEGIRILDLSRYLPGPLCTQILADFGAEVIKIEQPNTGELGRKLAPLIEGESSRFFSVNRNKKSITLDLKKEEGKEIFKSLVVDCDVVLDQFRPGVMDKMGLGYEVLKDINEEMIYCSLTGYGLDGPLRDAAGHDLNYLSLAGVTDQIGNHNENPAISGVQIADTAAGSLYSVIAILLALASREKTGKGQLCDVAMMDGAISLLAYGLGEWSGSGDLPQRGDETLTGGYACYHVYKTKDEKYVSLGAVEEKFWWEFCERIDRKEYIKLQWDKAKQESLIEDISNIIIEKTRDEWVEFLATSNICFTPVLNMEEMCSHPQVIARNMINKISNFKNSGKDMVLTGVPIKLSDTPGKAKYIFPELGQDNEDVLTAIGYSKEEIDNLYKKSVI